MLQRVASVDFNLQLVLPPQLVVHYTVETLYAILQDPLHYALIFRQASYKQLVLEHPQYALRDDPNEE